MKKTRLVIVSIGILVIIAACQGAGSQPQPASIRINLSEYAYNPLEIEVQEGQQVSIELVNIGRLDHEIMFGREVMLVDNRPAGYMTDMFASTGIDPQVDGGEMEEHMGHEGYTVIVKPGESSTLSFTVNKDSVGEWEIGCFEQEGVHYSAGMKGRFTVKP